MALDGVVEIAQQLAGDASPNLVAVVLDKLWALCLVAFLAKTLSDSYTCYFKWLQAKSAREQKTVGTKIETRVVQLMNDDTVIGTLIIGGVALTLFSLVLVPSLRSPYLTLLNLAMSAVVSLLGALADGRRRVTF